MRSGVYTHQRGVYTHQSGVYTHESGVYMLRAIPGQKNCWQLACITRNETFLLNPILVV